MNDKLTDLHRHIANCVHGTGGNRAEILPILLGLTDEELTGLLTYLHGDHMSHVREAAGTLLRERMTARSTKHMTELKGSIVSLMKEIDDSGKKATNAAYALAVVGVFVALVELAVAAIPYIPFLRDATLVGN